MEKTTLNFNRGDVAEGILGAALAAKFANRPKVLSEGYSKITKTDIDNMLDDFFSSGGHHVTSVKDVASSKKTKQVRDNIVLSINLPEKAINLLKKKSQRSVVYDLYESAIEYVESTWKKEVEQFAMNGIPDTIKISSDGVGDQKGTKADIKIKINGKDYKRQISLKVSGGEQFSQVSGEDFSKQIQIWNNLLGLDVSNMEKEYISSLRKYDDSAAFSSRDDKKLKALKDMVKSAAEPVYREAAKQIRKKISSKDKQFFTNFAKMVFVGATRGDESIELVKFVGGEFKRIKFDKNFVKQYSDSLKNSNMSVSYREDGDPLVQIHIEGKLLLQIRVKVEAASKSTKNGKMYTPYMRNYVESGPMMFSFFNQGKK